LKIDLRAASEAFLRAKWILLFLAVVLYTVSKLVSAYRLTIYFDNIRLKVPQLKNLQLYWLGMFYNLFLPGSISGDAYKVVILNRVYGSSIKKTTSAVLLDRFSGLLALGLILAAYGLFVLPNNFARFPLVTGAVAAVWIAWITIRFLFRDFLPGFWSTLLWGLVVQLSQVACIYLIMASLSIPFNQHAWVFIFLAASVISVLPISLGGGLGTRELVFVEGARYFHLNEQLGLEISLLFYFTSLLSAIWGVWYVFNDPMTGSMDHADHPH